MQADLAKCVQCGLCLTACPTFRLSGMEGYSPRGRIAAVRGAQALDAPPLMLEEYLGTCLGCRACESVCPSGVPYGRILEHARESMPPEGSRLSRIVERAALWTISRRGRLSAASLPIYAAQKLGLLGLVRGAAGIPRLKLRTLLARMGTNYIPDEGTERGQFVLFTGCVQDAWDRDVHWATIKVLTTLGYRVRVPYGQVCCGALHAHGGRVEPARLLALRNVDALTRYEGTIVVSSAGCGAKLKEYGDLVDDEDVAAIAKRVRDVNEVISPSDVERLGPRPPADLKRIAVHDPCHLNFVQKIREQPRALLRAAGYEVVDLPDGGRCCGAAGSFSVRHPEWAVPLLEDKIDACLATEPDAVAVANPGCSFWMASSARAPRLFHPIQLVAMALAAGSAGRPQESGESVREPD